MHASQPKLQSLTRALILIALTASAQSLMLAQGFQMSNDTHSQTGTPNFVVGDHYTVTITGAQPNASVVVALYQNGAVVNAGYPIGTTDSSGNWTFGSTEGSGTDGTWSETWYVGGVQIANINFFVLAQLPTVQQSNTSNSGLNFSTGADFVNGDNFRADVTSGTPAANQPVVLKATQNGNPVTVNLGTTDSSGNFTVSGTQHATELGDWTEQWFVGGLPTQQYLEFEVIAVPSSLNKLSTDVLSSPPSSKGCPSPYLGVWGDIKYQVVSSSGTYDTAVPMEPWEDITYATGGAPSSNAIGPTGYSNSTQYTATDGTFHDVPFGWCTLTPVPPSTTIAPTAWITQTISIYIGNNEYQVRSQNWVLSSSGFNHGTSTNNNDITISR